MANDFDKPIGEWTEESVEIATIEPTINKRGEVTGLKHGTRKATQKVRYDRLNAPQTISCASMQHSWFIPDPHNHVAHCHNCKKRQLIRSVYERVVDGKILDRDSDDQLG